MMDLCLVMMGFGLGVLATVVAKRIDRDAKVEQLTFERDTFRAAYEHRCAFLEGREQADFRYVKPKPANGDAEQ